MSKSEEKSRPSRASDLSVAQRQLLAFMQWIDYGRICGLHIRGGQPDLEHPIEYTKLVKVSGRSRPCEISGDFPLKQNVVELFDQFAELGHGMIETLEVQAGLPFRFEIRDRVRLKGEPHFGFFAKT